MSAMQTSTHTIFADYFQLYLTDDAVATALPERVSSDDRVRGLVAAPHLLVVHTRRNSDVSVTVNIHEREPALDLASWEHVAEGSLDLPSGKLILAGATDYLPTAARIEVKPATYRARVCLEVTPDAETCVIDLWLQPAAPVVVLKQRS